MRRDGLSGKGVSERKARGLTKAQPSSRARERGRESWESPWARYLDEAPGAAGGVKGSCLAELALRKEIEGLESVSKPWPPQRAQSSPDWTVTPYPDKHGDHYLLWLISSVAHRVGTRTYHIPMSQLETSVGGKTTTRWESSLPKPTSAFSAQRASPN